MPRPPRRKRARSKKSPEDATRYEVGESRTSEAVTIAWSLSVLTVVICELIAVGAHLYLMRNPQSRKMEVLEALMLLASCVIGLVVLGLVPVMSKIRRRPAPIGIVWFAVLVAIAPWLVVVLRAVL